MCTGGSNILPRRHTQLCGVPLTAGCIVSVRKTRLDVAFLLTLALAGESPTCVLQEGIHPVTRGRSIKRSLPLRVSIEFSMSRLFCFPSSLIISFYFPAQLISGIIYPQRPSGQAVVTGGFPSMILPLVYCHHISSRIQQ